MALFIPVIIGAPIGYFTWSRVFKAVDDRVYRITQLDNSSNISSQSNRTATIANHNKVEAQQGTRPPTSKMAAMGCSLVSAGLLGKLAFPPHVRHRLFFAKAPSNANIRVVTLKLGLELLARAGIVFYGAATGGAIGGRLLAKKE